MWVTWHYVFHCISTVRLATPLPASRFLLREVTAVAETCLSSCSLAMAITLAPLFRLSGVMSQYILSKLAITYIEFSIVLLTKFQNAHVPSLLVSRSITFAVNRYGLAAC
jgi:dipeptide/tripeptide permease